MCLISSSINPTWNETLFILVNSIQESLILDLFDFNDHRADTELGAATFELARLQEDATQEGINSTIFKDGKDRGELRYDVSYYPVLKPTMVDGKEEMPETSMSLLLIATDCIGSFDIYAFIISRRYRPINYSPSQGTGPHQIPLWRP